MIPANAPMQRPLQAKLLVIDAGGSVHHARRSQFIDFLDPSDLVIANDAATLPASLQGVHVASSTRIEVRLAGWRSLDDVTHFSAIVFGAGDFRTPTEHRPLPPSLSPGDRLMLGPLSAVILRLLDHPRLIALRFDGSSTAIWEGLARHGRPIQYAHLSTPLALWDVWTPIAGPPVAFESPSAGFILDWHSLVSMRKRGIGFASITHAAGISSTGDTELDRRLPFDEPYRISASTALAIRRQQLNGGRIVAIGTTVVRALEHAASHDGRIRAGVGIATQRIGPATQLRVVDAIVSGVHESGTSHHELLRAFAGDCVLRQATDEMERHAYRTHEFGDSVLIERSTRRAVDRSEGQCRVAA